MYILIKESNTHIISVYFWVIVFLRYFIHKETGISLDNYSHGYITSVYCSSYVSS